MATIKTKPTGLDVVNFIKGIEPAKKRADTLALKELFDSALNEEASLWNNNMIGYGTYHYKSEKSRQEGDWPLTGFSPRKQNISIYIMNGVSQYEELLKELGKFNVSSGSCIYINKLEDVNTEVLKKIIVLSVADMKKRWSV